MTEIVLPQHANALGTAFGGTVLVDGHLRCHCPHRHAVASAVTAAIDDLQFLAPIRVGDVVNLSARVNAAFGPQSRSGLRGARGPSLARTSCLDALLTFVCIAKNGKPAAVPPLRAVTADDRRRAAQARERRAQRLLRKRTS